MIKEMKMPCGAITIVDDDMYEILSKNKWHFDGRYVHRHQHLRMEGKKQIRKKIYMHKVINQTPQGLDTDHINGDKMDNRSENLRAVTRSQNNMNQQKRSGLSSKYKGVHRFRNKWKSEIKFNGKKKHLGVFHTEEEAAIAYNEAAQQRCGNFARLN